MDPIHGMWSDEPFDARYEALVRLSKAISAHREPKELFCVLASELRHLVRFDAIGVVLYDEAANRIRRPLLELCSQPGRLLELDIAPEETIASWVYQHQRPLVIPMLDREKRLPPSLPRRSPQDVWPSVRLRASVDHGPSVPWQHRGRQRAPGRLFPGGSPLSRARRGHRGAGGR